MIDDPAAKHISKRAADGDGHVKPGKDAPAAANGIEVGEDRRRDGSIGGLADADEGARQEEQPKGVFRRDARAAAGEAPEDDADADENPAAHALGEPAEQRGDHGVGEQEYRRRPAHLRLADAKCFFDFLFHRGEDLAINVVKQVDRQEQDHRPVRAAHRGVQGFVRGGFDGKSIGHPRILLLRTPIR